MVITAWEVYGAPPKMEGLWKSLHGEFMGPLKMEGLWESLYTADTNTHAGRREKPTTTYDCRQKGKKVTLCKNCVRASQIREKKIQTKSHRATLEKLNTK